MTWIMAFVLAAVVILLMEANDRAYYARERLKSDKIYNEALRRELEREANYWRSLSREYEKMLDEYKEEYHAE